MWSTPCGTPTLSKTVTEVKMASTPAKASRDGADCTACKKSAGVSSSARSLSSPEPPPIFARKSPPALHTKRRKAFSSSLFDSTSASASASGKQGVKGEDSEQPLGDTDSGSGQTTTSPVSGCAKDALDSSSFASPPRTQVRGGRAGNACITPQRNLGRLFASPVAPRRADPDESDESKAREDGATSRCAEDSATTGATWLQSRQRPSPPVGEETESRLPAVADMDGAVAAAASKDAGTEAPPAGRPQGEFTAAEDVSNTALRSRNAEAVCTLEVLVKHTRERVGVSALASWRVAELKRRLVYLKMFAEPDTITLVPRFGSQALGDDVTLGTLDADVTYEARAVPVV